jgi:hypothetical protein
MSCNSTSNNKYFGCPALMSDGRTFTDYRPRCMVNDQIKKANQLTNSYDFRQFLIHNAESLMKANQQYAIQKVSCKPCTFATNTLNSQTNCQLDIQSSTCGVVDPRGLGLTNQSIQNIRQGNAMIPVPMQMNFNQ